MSYKGYVKNGVVILQDGAALPEGTEVLVELSDSDPARTSGTPDDWKGKYRGQGPVPTEEDIREMRREAWPHW